MQRSEKGFTLLELMIVVAILGILAAIAIPNFISFKKKAVLAIAVANLDNARSILSQYAASQDNWCFPASTNDYNTFVTSLSAYGLKFPNSPGGVKWFSFDGYTRDPADCAAYTIAVTAADGETQFKALTMGVCCVDHLNCTRYANNVPQCQADFGL